MPNSNTYISPNTPIADQVNSTLFNRIWFRFFDMLGKKVAIIDGENSVTATAGAAAAVPATPEGYLTIIDNTGVKRKVPYYNE